MLLTMYNKHFMDSCARQLAALSLCVMLVPCPRRNSLLLLLQVHALVAC
jgi:hypothetical protein